MFNSIALEVVAGLVVIYLLYSLLGTILSEMAASVFGLRARNLREAISRMLNDDHPIGWFRRLMNSLNVLKSANDKAVNVFYNSPEIKYLGSTGLYRTPSSMKPESFSKALVDVLIGDKNIKNLKSGILEPETAGYIQDLWAEAQSDVAKFRLLLEDWFNRTMEQASEWYKRKIQLVLLVIGFCLAWFFGADTFMIVRNLSNDKKAREQMISLATIYAQSKPSAKDTSLSEIRNTLDVDLANANAVLGLGGWLPETVRVTINPRTNERIYQPRLDPRCLSVTHQKISNGTLTFTPGDKLSYFCRLAYYHFFGFLITALAISLGAPFWFDLLNKIMRLRTSAKMKPEKQMT